MTETAVRPSIEIHTSHENALALAMVHRAGSATVALANGEGLREPDNDLVSPDELGRLVDQFGREPKDSLAYARESLYTIAGDKQLNKVERERRLNRYLEAYFDLTVKLDNAAFPNSPAGKVEEGVPDYIPDGFIDMGGDPSTRSILREREQIWIDKRAILSANKDVLRDIFSDTEGLPLHRRKELITVALAEHVYFNMNYSKKAVKDAEFAGGKVRLSEMSEGVCRHQGLVFQVLAQAMGIKSRVLKSHMDGGRHSTNMVRVDNDWYILDVTNPDYVENDKGQKLWRPGLYHVDGPPKPGERKEYKVQQKHSKQKHTYTAHDKMYWRIEHS